MVLGRTPTEAWVDVGVTDGDTEGEGHSWRGAQPEQRWVGCGLKNM